MTKKNKKTEAVQLVTVDLSIGILDKIISYLFTTNINITRASVNNIGKLFSIADTRSYETDEEMYARIYFVQETVKLKLNGIHDMDLILEAMSESPYSEFIDEEIIPFLDNSDELSTDEVRYVNSWISERLSYSHLYYHKEPLFNVLEDFETGNYTSLKEINERMETILKRVTSAIRRAKVTETSNAYFDLTPDNFRNMVTDIATRLKEPSNKLKSGMKLNNDMLEGGYESGRCYVYMGPSGGGKSVVLLNILEQLRKYNQDYVPRDPAKRPTIVFLSQENTIDETIERLFNLTVTEDDIRNFEIDEIIEKFLKAGLSIDDNNNIDIRIMYRPGRSIRTDDLYDILEEIEEDGCEVIALIHDYTKRILPAKPTGDLRIDLGMVIDEFCILARALRIPVITAAQLNREAIKIVEQAVEAGQLDAIKKLGASHIGESWALIENADFACIILKEYKATLDKYFMTFKEVKARSKKSGIKHFAQPFRQNSGIHIMQDSLLDEPLGLTSLADETLTTTDVSTRGRKVAGKRKRAGKDTQKLDPITGTSDENDDEFLTP